MTSEHQTLSCVADDAVRGWRLDQFLARMAPDFSRSRWQTSIKAGLVRLNGNIARAKDKNDPFRLMGFGHRVYKNFDPRAKVLKSMCDKLFDEIGINTELLKIAKKIEEIALNDEYFISRNLYPNVDFYSGLILKALSIPNDMFAVIFVIGRIPGWISQWIELKEQESIKIVRPRQLYVGETNRTPK